MRRQEKIWRDLLEDYQISMDGHTSLIGCDFDIESRSIAVCCFGDSWTEGGSLPEESRANSTFGRKVSRYTDADWFNVGCPGWSNSYILGIAQHLCDALLSKSDYQKIYIIITLTENGRDVRTAKSFLFPYDTFSLKVGESRFIPELLHRIEQSWLDAINSMVQHTDNRFSFFVGSNCTWPFWMEQTPPSRTIFSADTWAELLADAQNMPRPDRCRIAYTWAIDSLTQSLRLGKIEDTMPSKRILMDLMDQSIRINQWFVDSALNYKEGAKHPTAEGHDIWAAHVIKNLNLDHAKRN